MISYFVIVSCFFVGLIFDVNPYALRNLTCGIDTSKISTVYEGVADIATYPWMGTLFYPIGKKRMTTSVVLVTKQIVIGSANEIDMLPKADVRSRSRVVLGNKCSGPSIKVRDFSFHPDYKRNSYRALAIIQLEVDLIQQELRPICSPPTYFIKPQFYAMTAGDCNKGKVRIYKMTYVPKQKCKQFYRKSGLHKGKYWPTHTACARAISGTSCKWRSGTALVVKQDGRWRLLGFGLHGPGCQSPARFLDYGMHQMWVRNSVARIGMPAITRVGDNHLIMRRSLGNLQRFGYCDREEKRHVIFTDHVHIVGKKIFSKATYNLTLYSNVEYSCIILRAVALEQSSEEQESESVEITTGLPTEKATKIYATDEESQETTTLQTLETSTKCQKKPANPRLHLKRWCAGSTKLCYGFQFIEMDFYVQIDFMFGTIFSIAAYGKVAKIIDPLKAMKFANRNKYPVKLSSYEDLLKSLQDKKDSDRTHRWFYKSDVGK